jgi:hypothetical protein
VFSIHPDLFFPQKNNYCPDSRPCDVAAEMFHNYEFLFVPYQAPQPDSIWSSEEKIFTHSYFWRLLERSGNFRKTSIS